MIERHEWATADEAPKQMIARESFGVRSIATEPIGVVPGCYDDPAGWARALWHLHVRGHHEGDVRFHAFVDAGGVVFEGRDDGLAPPYGVDSGVYLIGYATVDDAPTAETVAAVDDLVEAVAAHWSPIIGKTVARPFLSSELVASLDACTEAAAEVAKAERVEGVEAVAPGPGRAIGTFTAKKKAPAKKPAPRG